MGGHAAEIWHRPRTRKWASGRNLTIGHDKEVRAGRNLILGWNREISSGRNLGFGQGSRLRYFGHPDKALETAITGVSD